MKLVDAHALAYVLLNKHGLQDWTFTFNRRKRTFGLCNYSTCTIHLSAVLTELNGGAEVQDTLLHEVAHALAGPKAGHGPVWQELARRVGAKPQRCYSAEEVRQPPSRYLLFCPSCEASTPRHRRPTKVYACRGCCDRYNKGQFSNRYRLELHHLQGS